MCLIKLFSANIYPKIMLYNEDIVSNIKRLAQDLKIDSKIGRIPNVTQYKKKIKKAFTLISKKVEKNETLTNLEKLFYENYNTFIYKTSNKAYKQFTTLPHSKNKIRVLEFARLLVSYYKGDISIDVVNKGINVFNSISKFDFYEILELSNAFRLATIECVSNIACVITHSISMKNQSKKDRYSKRLSNDCFYIYYKNNSLEIVDQKFNNNQSVNELEEIAISKLIESTIELDNLIHLLDNLNHIFNKDYLLTFSDTFLLLNKNSDFNCLDVDSKIIYLKQIYKLSRLYNKSEYEIVTAAEYICNNNTKISDFGNLIFNYKYVIKAYFFNNKLINFSNNSSKTDQIVYLSIFAIVLAIISVLSAIFISSNVKYAVLILCIIIYVPFAKFAADLCGKSFIQNRAVEQNVNIKKSKINYFIIVDSINQKKLVEQRLKALSKLNNVSTYIVANSNLDIDFNNVILYDSKNKYEVVKYIILASLQSSYNFKFIETEYVFNKQIVIDNLDFDMKIELIRSSIRALSHPFNFHYDMLVYGNNKFGYDVCGFGDYSISGIYDVNKCFAKFQAISCSKVDFQNNLSVGFIKANHEKNVYTSNDVNSNIKGIFMRGIPKIYRFFYFYYFVKPLSIVSLVLLFLLGLQLRSQIIISISIVSMVLLPLIKTGKKYSDSLKVYNEMPQDNLRCKILEKNILTKYDLQGMPRTHVMSNPEMSLFADTFGKSFSSYKNRLLIDDDKLGIYDLFGDYILIDEGENVYSPTFAPLFNNPNNYSCDIYPGKIAYNNKEMNTELLMFLALKDNILIRECSILNNNNIYKKALIKYYHNLHNLVEVNAINKYCIFESFGVYVGIIIIGGNDINNNDEFLTKNLSKYISTNVSIKPHERIILSFAKIVSDDRYKLRELINKILLKKTLRYYLEYNKIETLSPAKKYLTNQAVFDIARYLVFYLHYMPMSLDKLKYIFTNSPKLVSENDRFVLYKYLGNKVELLNLINAVRYIQESLQNILLIVVFEAKYKQQINEYNKKNGTSNAIRFYSLESMSSKSKYELLSYCFTNYKGRLLYPNISNIEFVESNSEIVIKPKDLDLKYRISNYGFDKEGNIVSIGDNYSKTLAYKDGIILDNSFYHVSSKLPVQKLDNVYLCLQNNIVSIDEIKSRIVVDEIGRQITKVNVNDLEIEIGKTLIQNGQVKSIDVDVKNIGKNLSSFEILYESLQSNYTDNKYLIIEVIDKKIVKCTNSLNKQVTYVACKSEVNFCLDRSNNYSIFNIGLQGIISCQSQYHNPQCVLYTKEKLKARASVNRRFFVSTNLLSIKKAIIADDNELIISNVLIANMNKIELCTKNYLQNLLLNRYIFNQISNYILRIKQSEFGMSITKLGPCFIYNIKNDSNSIKNEIISMCRHQFLEGDFLNNYNAYFKGDRDKKLSNNFGFLEIIYEYVSFMNSDELFQMKVEYLVEEKENAYMKTEEEESVLSHVGRGISFLVKNITPEYYIKLLIILKKFMQFVGRKTQLKYSSIISKIEGNIIKMRNNAYFVKHIDNIELCVDYLFTDYCNDKEKEVIYSSIDINSNNYKTQDIISLMKLSLRLNDIKKYNKLNEMINPIKKSNNRKNLYYPPVYFDKYVSDECIELDANSAAMYHSVYIEYLLGLKITKDNIKIIGKPFIENQIVCYLNGYRQSINFVKSTQTGIIINGVNYSNLGQIPITNENQDIIIKF